MTRVHLDFETRSTVDIFAVGAWAYAHHPSTEILCGSYAVDNEEPVGLWGDEIVWDMRLRSLAMDPTVLFCAHNAFFEESVWRAKMVSFPRVDINRWVCTSAKALAAGYPRSLENVAIALGLTQHKDKLGYQIMKKLSQPRKPRKGESKDAIYWHNDQDEYKHLMEYCIQDVRTAREVDKALPDLSPAEYEVWCYDQLINIRGVRTDIDFAKTVISLVEETTTKFNTELQEITNGYISKGTEVEGIKRYFATQGVVMEALDKKSVTEAIAKGTLTPRLLRVLQLRQELGKSSIAKYARIVAAADSGGIIRGNYIYYGSHTGRWAGVNIQLQNLVKGPENTTEIIEGIKAGQTPTKNVMLTVASCIRGVFIPREGYEFNVVDYAAIEARVVMWLAQDATGLQDFNASDNKTDVEIYVKMAQRIYGNPSLTKENKTERQLGKQAVLGCGFGVGGAKFQTTCDGYGIKISEYDATRIVNLYRSTYANVEKFWYALCDTAIQAIQYPRVWVSCGHLAWLYDTKTLFCRLPSERVLWYPQASIGTGKFGTPCLSYMTEVKGQWVKDDLWGGSICENVTQATARDIMAYSIAPLERQGFKVVMHTHDEIVTETLQGSNRLKEMTEIMTTVPTWAKGLPVKASGFVCDRYRKE